MAALDSSQAGVALVTLFDERGSVDATATATLTEQLVGRGVRAVVVAGTTGEAASFDPDESSKLLAAVRGAVSARSGVAVIAGTGAPSASQAVWLTAAARDGGADGVLTLSPPGGGDLHSYYDAVVAVAGGLPVLAYHYPAVSSPGIAVDVLRDLPVDGCKDSSGSADRLLETITASDRPLYVRSAALLALAGPLGCAEPFSPLPIRSRRPAPPPSVVTSQRKLAGAHARARSNFPHGIKQLTAERFGTSVASRMG